MQLLTEAHWEALQYAHQRHAANPTAENKQAALLCLSQWQSSYIDFCNGKHEQVRVN